MRIQESIAGREKSVEQEVVEGNSRVTEVGAVPCSKIKVN